jgi:hypothetical protein
MHMVPRLLHCLRLPVVAVLVRLSLGMRFLGLLLLVAVLVAAAAVQTAFEGAVSVWILCATVHFG